MKKCDAETQYDASAKKKTTDVQTSPVKNKPAKP
jgi:hypothetical protein